MPLGAASGSASGWLGPCLGRAQRVGQRGQARHRVLGPRRPASGSRSLRGPARWGGWDRRRRPPAGSCRRRPSGRRPPARPAPSRRSTASSSAGRRRRRAAGARRRCRNRRVTPAACRRAAWARPVGAAGLAADQHHRLGGGLQRLGGGVDRRAGRGGPHRLLGDDHRPWWSPARRSRPAGSGWPGRRAARSSRPPPRRPGRRRRRGCRPTSPRPSWARPAPGCRSSAARRTGGDRWRGRRSH